jgi:hypothetical protein
VQGIGAWRRLNLNVVLEVPEFVEVVHGGRRVGSPRAHPIDHDEVRGQVLRAQGSAARTQDIGPIKLFWPAARGRDPAHELCAGRSSSRRTTSSPAAAPHESDSDRPRDPSRRRTDYFFFGTFAPALRASESPIAMACLRLVTFFPLPLRSVPCFRSCIVFFTFACAVFPYLVAMIHLRSK